MITKTSIRRFLKSLYITICNLFFGNNNYIYAYFRAKLAGGGIYLGSNVRLKNCTFEINGKGNVVRVGNNCCLRGLRIYINSDNNYIEIGDKTTVNANKEQRTYFNPCDGGRILIGHDCLFSNNIELHTTDYHKVFEIDDKNIILNTPQDIVIGSHCWIGLQTLILKGTELSDHTIVGARSILNKKFHDSNVIIAGGPARVVKKNVQWDF